MLLPYNSRFNTDLTSQIVSSSLTIHPLQTSKESVTSGSVYVRKNVRCSLQLSRGKYTDLYLELVRGRPTYCPASRRILTTSFLRPFTR
jgi:hypothetical protein